jgi:hypothetical protein
MPIALRYSSLERKRVSWERARSGAVERTGDGIPDCSEATALAPASRTLT